MAKLNVTVQCLAVYNSSIIVPDGLSKEEAIEYAQENIKDIPLGVLEYVPDSDDLDIENCDFADDDDDEAKIAELKREIAYEKERMNCCGTSKGDLLYLQSLEEKLENYLDEDEDDYED